MTKVFWRLNRRRCNQGHIRDTRKTTLKVVEFLSTEEADKKPKKKKKGGEGGERSYHRIIFFKFELNFESTPKYTQTIKKL